MNVFLSSGLWVVASLVPGLSVTGGAVKCVRATTADALLRLARDPLPSSARASTRCAAWWT